MNSIYQQATLTIAAGATRDSNDGILRQRLGPEAPPCTIPVRISEGLSGLESGSYGMTVALPQPKSNELLDSRAWALQGLLLSPRIHFF